MFKDVRELIVDSYWLLRRDSRNAYEKETTYINPRTLLTIIRLSTSLAKLRMSKYVSREDVKESLHLMSQSQSQSQIENYIPITSKSDKIFHIIKKFSEGKNSVELSQLKK